MVYVDRAQLEFRWAATLRSQEWTGYRFGDRQLQAVGGRLRAMLPDDVHVARVGSDVFGVFGRSELVNPASLRAILLPPFDSEGGLHTISFSIGLVRADAVDADGPIRREQPLRDELGQRQPDLQALGNR